MYKCPKCEYRSENPGTCPTDNEVLQEEVETPQPSTAEPSAPAEAEQQPETPETPETPTEPEGESTQEETPSQ